uniref:Uncharacterized protein n=1 Tax=Oryza glumipatula TaxID=40148 RepID=A0A0D9YKN2_9ORYZ
MSHSHNQVLYFQAQRKVRFQDNQANIMKEVPIGTNEKLVHDQRMKDDKNKDLDSVASDFIKLKHRAWALQKSASMYQPS